ncbi:Segregation and condensation protein B [Chondromyces apiculatus DSM 436]|uniref:Segregation and condensation protein B n=1 Tax=Chondromyces apiculatus DSM 436 TaxID=1192034 RepID=A0A017SXL5_9BACT|nr:Segregation and condensation protein B [Chondromyces apiculatus DSM 436]
MERFRAAAFAWLSGGLQGAAPGVEAASVANPPLHPGAEATRQEGKWTREDGKGSQKAPRRDKGLRFRAAAWAHFQHLVQARAQLAASLSPVARRHLKGVLEALIFAADKPMPARELARAANAEPRVVRELLAELLADYEGRGFRLDEVAGGFVFRTSPAFAPFVREMTDQKPVRMSRAQLETLAIVAYRQPVTRPEVDEVRGVDSGAALKSLLERNLVRILGKKDEPGRPMIYGTTPQFLEFFGLRALNELPTLREFTELTDDSRRTYEREMGEDPPEAATEGAATGGFAGAEGSLQAFMVEPAGSRDAGLEMVPGAAPEFVTPEHSAVLEDWTEVERAEHSVESEEPLKGGA